MQPVRFPRFTAGVADGPEPRRAVPGLLLGRRDFLNNLYACDGGVFPTSSGYNPTLTIIAVALKIAHGIAGTPPILS